MGKNCRRSWLNSRSTSTAVYPKKMADEYGDVLFSMVNVGRLLKLNAEDSLRLTNQKFHRRFAYIEEVLARQGKTPDQVSLEEMDRLWDEAKKLEGT